MNKLATLAALPLLLGGCVSPQGLSAMQRLAPASVGQLLGGDDASSTTSRQEGTGSAPSSSVVRPPPASGGAALVQAAASGIAPGDLARDHQHMEELWSRFQAQSEQRPDNPHNDDLAKNRAYIEALDAFTSTAEYREMAQAVADFAAKYGSDRNAIRASFRTANGGDDWLSPQRKVPEAGYRKLSEGLAWIASDRTNTLEYLVEIVDRAQRVYGDGGSALADPKHPELAQGQLNEMFAQYRGALELVLRCDPKMASARAKLDGLEPLRTRFVERMNQAIDAVRLAPSGTGFQGDLRQAERAVRDYWQAKGDEVLAVSIVGNWYVFDRDLAGQPLHYALPADVVSAMQGDGATGHVYRMTMITRDRAPTPPFAKAGVGKSWHIRVNNLH